MISVRYRIPKKQKVTVLNESHLEKADYDKHSGKYRKAVIDILRTPGAILKLNDYGDVIEKWTWDNKTLVGIEYFEYTYY